MCFNTFCNMYTDVFCIKFIFELRDMHTWMCELIPALVYSVRLAGVRWYSVR